MNTSVNTMVAHIRSILDENETNTELSGVNGVRQLTIEDVIKTHLVSGVDAITMLAPAYMIEASSSTFATTDNKLIIPSEALKVLWLKANGWNRSVTEVHDPAERLYKAAYHGRVGSVCNANSPLAFELAESFNPYGSEVLAFKGAVETLPTYATKNDVYLKTTNNHTYKCTLTGNEHSGTYEFDTYAGDMIEGEDAVYALEIARTEGENEIEIYGETYTIKKVLHSSGEYIFEAWEDDQCDKYLTWESGAFGLELKSQDFSNSVITIVEVSIISTYSDLGVLPTNETTARVIQCFPSPSGTPKGWIQYAKKAVMTSTSINVSTKLYEPSCLYIAGLVCDSLGLAKNRDYKQDAMLMLGIQMQSPGQNVNG